MGFRGKLWAAVALTACCALAPASAQGAEKPSRLLLVGANTSASNGYRFSLNAARSQPGGGSVSIQVSNGTSAVTYIQRRPQQVSKRRVVADFGSLGSVDLRFEDKLDFPHRAGGRCTRIGIGIGEFRGKLRFEGENGFTRVRKRQLSGIVQNIRTPRGCDGGRPFPPLPPLPFSKRFDISFLSSCGGDAGAGFFVLDFEGVDEPFFMASKTQVDGTLTTVRTLDLNGADRRFAVTGPEAARVAPPDPFSGMARLRDGMLEGRLTAPLPGIGEVRLTPGRAHLNAGGLRVPECFPTFLPYGVSAVGVNTADAAIAGQATRSILPRNVRALLGR